MSKPAAVLTTINPRYNLYARAHGRGAMAQMKHDEETYLGGCMTGFILWIAEQHKAFWDYLGIPERDPSPLQTPREALAQLMTNDYQERFDRWLEIRVDEICLRRHA